MLFLCELNWLEKCFEGPKALTGFKPARAFNIQFCMDVIYKFLPYSQPFLTGSLI